MRSLKFEGVARPYFDIIYEGLASTQTRGAETRLLAKIFIKMEEHGKLHDKLPLYKLQEKETPTIVLEDAEWELAKKLLDTVEWSGVGARKAGMMMDWLDSIPAEKLIKAEK